MIWVWPSIQHCQAKSRWFPSPALTSAVFPVSPVWREVWGLESSPSLALVLGLWPAQLSAMPTLSPLASSASALVSLLNLCQMTHVRISCAGLCPGRFVAKALCPSQGQASFWYYQEVMGLAIFSLISLIARFIIRCQWLSVICHLAWAPVQCTVCIHHHLPQETNSVISLLLGFAK